ncbi:dicarboxylate/amino acid:cation symporter [Bradyrhizobium embrapense]|uniref:dicarboxylate/amino acid:cation symporter n=1 Tax=Bradyrhizobium embrapense TaxID=630921 RepID=UPI00067B3C6B|nr:dicarboxylate/amino acid:cation symporter [Bradyrhizobium embrapense]
MSASANQEPRKKRPFYTILYVQVLAAIVVAIALGHFWPGIAVDMKPFGDGFIKLIKMVIALAIFCTVVTGIAGMSDMKKVSRVGGKALLYFEVLSTLALLIGFIAAHVATPGAGFNVDPATLDAKAVAQYAGKAKEQTIAEFLLNIIPNTVTDAFARGDILPVVLVSILLGCVLSRLGERARPVRDMIDGGSMLIFGAINVIMRFAPIGAFGAMAFTVGRYGIASLGPLVKLVGLFYLTSAVFVFGVLGPIAWWSGFSIWKFLIYIKEEILIVLGMSSSDPVLPSLMEKLERLGCSKPVVGLVVPTGYVFNTDGSSIYMTLAALFVAQATNTDLTLSQQIAILAVAMLTSKGASGVTGASFIALVGTLSVVPTIPVAGMALILGIDRFMSEARALVNVIGNGVATIVIARTEGELDPARLNAVLDGNATGDEREVTPAAVVDVNPLPARNQV